MEPLKNNFSPNLVALVADHLEEQLDGFERRAFEEPILRGLRELELKARAQLIADHLHRALPRDLSARYRIVRAMLHPDEHANIEQQSDKRGIRGWGMIPLGLVVGQHGTDDFESSLLLLKEMTSRFSSEFEIRYFLVADQDRALRTMREWVTDPSRHVRRLVSEGTRPRLPWAMQLRGLIADPSPSLPLLEALRDDEEDYVRRSVANHLNDIAKDHPDLVADIAEDWMRGATPHRERLLRHACRTLIKKGHPKTLAIFAYESPAVELTSLSIQPSAASLGQKLRFTAHLRSTSRNIQSLVVDYVLHFRKANGNRVGKVFKWKTTSIAPGETLALQRLHSIRPITTRKYYSGQQALSLRVNGQDFGFREFTLNAEIP